MRFTFHFKKIAEDILNLLGDFNIYIVSIHLYFKFRFFFVIVQMTLELKYKLNMI